jgi:hypothetical protein
MASLSGSESFERMFPIVPEPTFSNVMKWSGLATGAWLAVAHVPSCFQFPGGCSGQPLFFTSTSLVIFDPEPGGGEISVPVPVR